MIASKNWVPLTRIRAVRQGDMTIGRAWSREHWSNRLQRTGTFLEAKKNLELRWGRGKFEV